MSVNHLLIGLEVNFFDTYLTKYKLGVGSHQFLLKLKSNAYTSQDEYVSYHKRASKSFMRRAIGTFNKGHNKQYVVLRNDMLLRLLFY